MCQSFVFHEAPPKHTVIKTAKIGDKEDMKINKGKATHYVQGDSQKAIS